LGAQGSAGSRGGRWTARPHPDPQRADLRVCGHEAADRPWFSGLPGGCWTTRSADLHEPL